MLEIWNIFNFIYEEYNSIYNLEFITKKENIKINNLSINNDFYYKKYLDDNNQNKIKLINDKDYKIIKKSILNDFIINFGKKNNYKNIIIDVHENMKRYDYELKEEGFKIDYNYQFNHNYSNDNLNIIKTI